MLLGGSREGGERKKCFDSMDSANVLIAYRICTYSSLVLCSHFSASGSFGITLVELPFAASFFSSFLFGLSTWTPWTVMSIMFTVLMLYHTPCLYHIVCLSYFVSSRCVTTGIRHVLSDASNLKI